MVTFRGRQAQKIINQRVVNGALAYVVQRGDGTTVHLNVVLRYKHLGLSTAFSELDTVDTRKKASSALSAYVPLALRIFGSGRIYTGTKLALLNSLISSRLFFNGQLSPPKKSTLKILNGPYMRVIRRIFGDVRGKDMKHSDRSLRDLHCLPSVDCLLQRARLKYAARLAQNKPRELLALLSFSTRGSKLPWVQTLVDDLVTIREIMKEQFGKDIGDPEVDAHLWFMVMDSFPTEWAEGVDRLFFVRSACDPPEKSGTDWLALEDPLVHAPHSCSSCGLFFATAKALGMHSRVVHGSRCEARLYVGADACCPICHTKFGSRLRAIAHLSDPRRTACSQRLDPIFQLLPQTVDELDEIDKVERRLARRAGHSRPLAVGQAFSASGLLRGRARPA